MYLIPNGSSDEENKGTAVVDSDGAIDCVGRRNRGFIEIVRRRSVPLCYLLDHVPGGVDVQTA